MKASTLFLGFTLVVLAAVLAGLWQAFGPRPAPHPKPAAQQVAAVAKRPPPVTQPEPNPPDEGVRAVYPGGRPSAPRAPQPETSPPAVIIPPAAPEPVPAANPFPAPPPAPERSAALTPPGVPRASEPASSDPTAIGEGVDLNTASAEALNSLGAGKIAKTIIANRPYTIPDDLVTRRVLKRKDYDAIKARVVVR